MIFSVLTREILLVSICRRFARSFIDRVTNFSTGGGVDGISVASGVNRGVEGPACVPSGIPVCILSGLETGVDAADPQAANPIRSSKLTEIMHKYLTESSSFL
jgi:hypothetical protein